MIEYKLPLKMKKYSKCFSYHTSLLCNLINNPFLNSRNSANYENVEGFQPIVQSLLRDCFSIIKSLLVLVVAIYILIPLYLYSSCIYTIYHVVNKWDYL